MNIDYQEYSQLDINKKVDSELIKLSIQFEKEHE